jgi:two-component system chemotaxis response regulator CheY
VARVRLRAQETARSADPDEQGPDAAPFRPESILMQVPPTVLLCDDSRALRMLAARQLADAGFEVVAEAGNGEEAIAQYKAHAPAVVLLDLVMPRLDGKQALRAILQHDADAKVVILSSLGAQGDIEECLRMGAASYLQKPIDPDAMVRVLQQVVGQAVPNFQ